MAPPNIPKCTSKVTFRSGTMPYAYIISIKLLRVEYLLRSPIRKDFVGAFLNQAPYGGVVVGAHM